MVLNGGMMDALASECPRLCAVEMHGGAVSEEEAEVVVWRYSVLFVDCGSPPITKIDSAKRVNGLGLRS